MSAPELERLLAAATPFLDVRAPAEAARGSLPGATNLPLLDDEERRRVGITYKFSGHDAAVALGHRLVSGEVRRAREQAWRAFLDEHPDAWIFCWRGGQRSEIVQAWLRELGIERPRVPGGYKALRQTCLAVLERAPGEKRWIVLGGRTGSGKTRLLGRLDNAIDLEGIARHRGSAFGAMATPQPPPATFENTLACAFLRHRAAALVVEDESRTIGRLALPQPWHECMQQAPLALLEVPLPERIDNIVREYVTEPLARGTPPAHLHARYADALTRIQRRLGGDRHREVAQALERGFAEGDHHGWVERLLVWYYDPMYDHQLAGKTARVVVRGAPAEVEGYLRSA
ncbi:MAG TPA: tRNA 2-selenouridine(34) synthase MnmH [Pseudomonadales bacterium]